MSIRIPDDCCCLTTFLANVFKFRPLPNRPCKNKMEYSLLLLLLSFPSSLSSVLVVLVFFVAAKNSVCNLIGDASSATLVDAISVLVVLLKKRRPDVEVDEIILLSIIDDDAVNDDIV